MIDYWRNIFTNMLFIEKPSGFNRIHITKYFLMLIIFFSIKIYSQNFEISGTVKDTSGNRLSEVNIVVVGQDIGAASNDDGYYSISNIKPGNYQIEFSSIGYQPYITGIKILNSSVTVNAILKEKPVETKQVIVTAGKHAQEISELPVSAEVIPSKDLTERNISNLRYALEYAPGVNMVEDQVSIRGSSGYSRGAGTRVLLALDGIPFYTGDTGEIIWEIIPVSEIQRVEIIKGAASSLYGSSAIGGVINVITKDITKKPLTYFKAYIGSYDETSYDEWNWWGKGKYRLFNGLTLSHSNTFGNFGFTLALTRIEDSGYKQSGFFKRYVGYFKGKYKFSQFSDLSLFVNSINQRSGNFIYWKDINHALVPPDADQGQRTMSNRYMFGIIYKNVFSKDFSINVRSSYYNTNWSDQTTSHNSSTTNLYRTEIQSNNKISDNFILTSGIEGTASNVNSNIFGKPNANGFGAYSQADVKFNFPLSLSAGVRYDIDKIKTLETFDAVSPKFGVNYKLSDKLIFRSSLGTGFRAPSLAEAFTSTTASGIIVRPNPNIKPEHNFTFEIGANYQLWSNLNFDAAIFNNEYYDFIEPELLVDSLGVSFGRFDNISRARIQGFEIDTKYNIIPDKLNLSLSYTYLWARDINTNKALKYRPRHMFYVNLDYKLSPFEFGSDFRYLSRVEEIDNLSQFITDGNRRVAVYVLDLRAGYNFITFNVPGRLFINVNNVLNYYYVELIGNISPIRNASLSFELFF
ncbi:MAG: TonB-dependent receptor [Ignavibacteriaceae bacterium]